MMDVVSFCALRVSSISWQPREGAHALTVICKATFELRLGESPLAAIAEDIWDVTAPVSDMAPFKRRADVFVVGHAHPPKQHKIVGTVVSLIARLHVGSLHKSIDVRADQAWSLNGFAPIAPSSPSRTALLGRHALSFDARSWNTRPLPEDVDGAFFNVAPVDQQIADLMGDEAIVLEHLHPTFARLETKLVRVAPRVSVQRTSGQVQDVRMRCDTLCIDADKQIAMLVFRGVVLLSHANEEGLVAVTAEGAAGGADVDVSATLTLSLPTGQNVVQANALPFVAAESGSSSIMACDNEAEARARVERSDNDATGTIALWFPSITLTRTPVTPFEQKAQRTSTPSEPDAESANSAHQEAAAPPIAMPFDVPKPALLARTGQAEIATERVAPVIEVPANIGPIIVRADKPVALIPAAASPPLAEAPRPLANPDEEEKEETATLSLNQAAEIAAELAEGKEERAKVLVRNGLRERTWRPNERRWSGAIEAESTRGVHKLRAAWDEAYVAKVETFRGPIRLTEYTRIVVALERGQANEVLDALKIQRPALMPIVRLWTRKIAKDMKLGDAANDALRVARRG